MSKGLSKRQQVILGILGGSIRSQCYASGDELTTGELVEELESGGHLDRETNRKQRLFTVRRACDSLLSRGLLKGKTVLCDPYSVDTISWSAVVDHTRVK